MVNHENIKLTSSELAIFHQSYIQDTLLICTVSHFLEHVEDPDIQACLEYALELSKIHVEMNRKLFEVEGIPIPIGFSEQDVNKNAPRIFSDPLILQYALNIGMMGINAYGMALNSSTRKDVREHFSSCLQSSIELANRATDVLLGKGLYIRPPQIPYPTKNEFVLKDHFLAGWIGEQRSLTNLEISLLFMNLYRNTLGGTILTGFAQIAHSKEVRKHMGKGAEVAKHHSAVFHKFLSDGNISAPTPWNMEVTTSTVPIFSDKLLMFHTLAINNLGISVYGQSIAGSQRNDLTAAYSRLLVEAGEYSLEGANIMIANGWLEKPPSAPNRKNLAGG